MFTGLVESVGHVLESRATGAGVRVRIETTLAPELTLGESLAVNGVCLTVVGHDDTSVQADIGPETLRVTTLGGLAPGSAVNLERSMRADSRCWCSARRALCVIRRASAQSDSGATPFSCRRISRRSIQHS